MATRFTDERLAWLAVRDQLSRKAGRARLLSRLLGGRGARYRKDGVLLDSGGRDNEIIGEKMRDYALAVDDVAQRLTSDERRILRATGKVPEWFLDDVEREVVEIRRRR